MKVFLPIRTILTGSLALILPALSRAQTWDGTTNSNNSGSWNTATNWSGDVIPTGAVILGDVTSGNRVITVDTTPSTPTDVDIVQTTAGATNAVTLNANLSVNAAAAQWWGAAANAGAGVGAVTLDLNGFVLRNTNTGSRRNTFANTINIGGASGNAAILGANGGNSYDYAFAGDVNVTGFGRIGRDAGTLNSNFTFNMLNGSTLDVGAATLAITNLSTSVTASTTALVGNFQAGSTTTVAAGGAVSFRLTNSATPGGNKDISVANNGNIILSGSLNGRSFGTGAVTYTNNASLKVVGAAATLGRLDNTGSGDGAAPTFTNSATGVLSSDGGGAASTFTYDDDVAAGSSVAFTQNGTIAPGGTSTSGLDGVGALTLTNFDTTFGSTGILALQVGGTGGSQFDTLTVSGGTFLTGAIGDTVNITLTNGFDPVVSQVWQLFSLTNGATIGGDGFTNVSLPSSINGSFSFDNDINSPSFGQLAFTVVPEPSSGTLVACGLCAIASWREQQRRRRFGREKRQGHMGV
jgi:hypothetical protein